MGSSSCRPPNWPQISNFSLNPDAFGAGLHTASSLPFAILHTLLRPRQHHHPPLTRAPPFRVDAAAASE
jgi:hypothetical protein